MAKTTGSHVVSSLQSTTGLDSIKKESWLIYRRNRVLSCWEWKPQQPSILARTLQFPHLISNHIHRLFTRFEESCPRFIKLPICGSSVPTKDAGLVSRHTYPDHLSVGVAATNVICHRFRLWRLIFPIPQKKLAGILIWWTSWTLNAAYEENGEAVLFWNWHDFPHRLLSHYGLYSVCNTSPLHLLLSINLTQHAKCLAGLPSSALLPWMCTSI